MANIKWLEGNRLQIAPPSSTKKITGTRFATILGLNPWSTEFEMWCAITKTFELPSKTPSTLWLVRPSNPNRLSI